MLTPLRSSTVLKSFSVWPLNTDFSRWCEEHMETEQQRAEYVKDFHAAEMKWAKRCLLAMFVLFCLSIAIGATALGIAKATTPNASSQPSP